MTLQPCQDGAMHADMTARARRRSTWRLRVGDARGDSSPRRIVIVAFPDVQVLDVTGPLEVFAATARWLAARRGCVEPVYTVEVVARRAGVLATSSGLRLVADRAFGTIRSGVDTLLVAGGRGTQGAMRDLTLLAWLRRMALRVRRLGSVCSGTFILAEAGLLAGRRVTTHWASCAALAARYPALRVDPDPIFVRDGHVITSAGVTAGMDLALALVDEDHGREVALEVARHLVLFLRRPGGQSQFSAALAAQTAEREPIRDLQAWVAEHPEADLSVPSLAAQAAMSPRNFARVFTRQVGMTPARYVEAIRVEAARRRLEETGDGVEGIAARCGFGSAESMRRAFLRVVRVSPHAYRGRFRVAS
jgi:transcriptional regulator GlxA family with amidase domain